MGKRVSRKVTGQQAATAPCPSCGRLNHASAKTCWACGAALGKPAPAPSPPAPVLNVDFPKVQESRSRSKKSIWTGRITFGLDGQPSSYAAVRTAMAGATLFPPLFLLAIVLALIGLARGEPSAGKVLGGIIAVFVVYGLIAGALILLIIHMVSLIQL